MVNQLSVTMGKFELRIGQHDPLTGKSNLITSLYLIVDPSMNYIFFAEKNDETFRERLKTFMRHHAIVAPNWHPDTSALDNYGWTIRLITEFVAPAGKRYFAIQIKGIVPD